MKATGIVRKVDSLHRLVIPQEICTTKGIDASTPLEIFVDGDNIILRKYQPGCTFCGDVKDLREFGGQHICGKCVETIREALSD